MTMPAPTNPAVERVGAIDKSVSPFTTAVRMLSDPEWHDRIKMPISREAGKLLADLTAGATKLTTGVMQKKGPAVTELVRLGLIRVNIKQRKAGITPGKIMAAKVIALADEMIPLIDEWRHTQ